MEELEARRDLNWLFRREVGTGCLICSTKETIPRPMEEKRLSILWDPAGHGS